MSLQTDIKLLFPKFIEDCNQLLPDGAADSGRCRGSAHITHIAQQRLHAHCLQMIVKAQWTPDSPNLNSLETSCLGSDARSVFESII